MSETKLKVCGLVAVVVAYATYFIGNAIQGTQAADGLLFGTYEPTPVILGLGTVMWAGVGFAVSTRISIRRSGD